MRLSKCTKSILIGRKILSNKPTGEVYNEPKPGYNFNGDKSMISVIINATFNDDSLIQ